jgi:hypothetical protein
MKYIVAASMANRGERSTIGSRLRYIAMIVTAVVVFSTSRADAAVIDFGTFVDQTLRPVRSTLKMASSSLSSLERHSEFWVRSLEIPSALVVASVSASNWRHNLDHKQGGGLFTFDAFDFASFTGIPPDAVNLIGLVNGVQAEQLLGVSSNLSAFVTSDPFLNPIDELRIVGTAQGGQTLTLDNFVVTPIPESATLLLVGSALGGLIARRRFRRSTARGKS